MNLNIPKKFIHQQVEGGGIISFLNEKEESRLMTGEEIVECLNKQQATIQSLKDENEQLKQEVFVYKKAFQEQVQRCIL